MKNLFLDDIRDAPPGFEPVRTVSAFFDAVEVNEWHTISLDYDICDGMDGLDAANQIIMNWKDGKLKNLKRIIIHSSNIKGRRLIYDKIKAEMVIQVVVAPLLHQSNLPDTTFNETVFQNKRGD